MLEFNEPIRKAIKIYNDEFAHRLNGVELSFTGSKSRSYQLYFKDAQSGRIECSILSGNRKEILMGIHSISQFSANRFPIIKTLVS